MSQFWENLWTDGRTDEAEGGGPKKLKKKRTQQNLQVIQY